MSPFNLIGSRYQGIALALTAAVVLLVCTTSLFSFDKKKLRSDRQGVQLDMVLPQTPWASGVLAAKPLGTSLTQALPPTYNSFTQAVPSTYSSFTQAWPSTYSSYLTPDVTFPTKSDFEEQRLSPTTEGVNLFGKVPGSVGLPAPGGYPPQVSQPSAWSHGQAPPIFPKTTQPLPQSQIKFARSDIYWPSDAVPNVIAYSDKSTSQTPSITPARPILNPPATTAAVPNVAASDKVTTQKSFSKLEPVTNSKKDDVHSTSSSKAKDDKRVPEKSKASSSSSKKKGK